MSKETLTVECHFCGAYVVAEIKGQHTEFDQLVGELSRCSLCSCPKCSGPVVVLQSADPAQEPDWSDPKRVWPLPPFRPSWALPPIVRESLAESQICLKAGAYRASAVMSGRALEGLCSQFTSSNTSLAADLKTLLQNKVIDDRLFSWAEELRLHRNLGAHATSERISHQEAEDLFDFAVAICEYVFVLSKKFNEFMKRKKAKPGRRKVQQ